MCFVLIMNTFQNRWSPTVLITGLCLITLLSPNITFSEGTASEEKFDVHVKIDGTDTMMYSKTSFEIKSNQKVKLTFKNTGKLPKVAMGHNIVILKKTVNLFEFCNEAVKFPTNEYFPKGREKDVIGRTKLLGPGEEDTIYFMAPDPGIYEFVCTFPGHFALMKGKMTVK
jgi:azurin